MSVPFLTNSRRATTDIVVEIARSQAPPTLPFELRDYVSPNTWENRVSLLAQLASQYCRPTFERAYLVVIMVLTFLVPITTYYVSLQALENTTDNIGQQVWFARFIAFATTIATWFVLSAPVIVWKYMGNVRVTKLAKQWTRTDALAAPTYGAAPVWRATAPGLFRNLIVLEVSVPSTKKSTFDRDSCLPAYIAAGEDGLPSYVDTNAAQWSKDLTGGIKYGELPIFTDELSAV
ncbi:hypothetical protein V8E55_004645 [Tylopilus felleus]|jgi:hypothetical protein